MYRDIKIELNALEHWICRVCSLLLHWARATVIYQVKVWYTYTLGVIIYSKLRIGIWSMWISMKNWILDRVCFLQKIHLRLFKLPNRPLKKHKGFCQKYKGKFGFLYFWHFCPIFPINHYFEGHRSICLINSVLLIPIMF